MKYFLIVFLSILGLSACRQKHFYNQYESVNREKWKSTDTLRYEINIEDSDAFYSLYISARHEKNYEFSNLWLNVYTTYFEAKKIFRYEIPLFKKDGKPFGEVSGSLCTQTIPFQKNIQFPQRGKYVIHIVHLMRKDPLNGISDIGVIIDKH